MARPATAPKATTPHFRVTDPPPRKRRRHEIPVRVMKQLAREQREKEKEDGLIAIEKLVNSRRDVFEAGRNGLQASRARAILAYLQMVVKNHRARIDASERAAEANGFAAKWGGKLWVSNRDLPSSLRGSHVKVFSIFEDPAIRAELRSFIRTKKWSMDPATLAEFTKTNSIPAAAEKYTRDLIDEEMPRGLKQYMELELFPRIGLKAGKKGVSLQTARRFLHAEGFRFTEHKKALYYDGHERPDNDGKKKSWVLNGEYLLKKKGQGRGMHESGVICSTVGQMPDAGQSLEYGKNYEGYWTGEMFVEQLRSKIIPTFERMHGYQALIMVDNSQGHSAYSKDALVASRMNLRPGGKQAIMRNGWFFRDRTKIPQEMNFPSDHAQFPNQPKGMRQLNFIEFYWGAVKRWLRENCDYTFIGLQENLPRALASVELSTIRKWEHRMIRWMDAYRSGLSARDAQFQVKKFSSRKYTSHRRIPESLARQFD
ncbi:hypothetical protein BDN70DRAFT_982834 [Pholiota conissans]|uniref:Uncharacterized protein n=1 Tax=Pholiota conissans TaxID=109636 RepID=A0A9P5Z2U3_9AGAR|nr:hypothetical protein BDN70DRAFT_982834 [Pholiota conissans]